MNNVKQINRFTMRLLSMCVILFFSALTNHIIGQTHNLEGTWRIDQIKVKRTVNNVSSEKTYNSRQRIDLFADCPQKITFTTDKKIIFEYNDKEPSEGTFTIEGNKIKRILSAEVLEYEYSITDNKIQLLYSINYVYSHNKGKSEVIIENCTFQGTKE